MSAIGSWKARMSTPVGPQDMVLHIDTLDSAFTGRIESPMGNHSIAGTASAGTLHWQMKAAKPMPITVSFAVRFEEDRLSGSAKLGFLGKSTITGERLAAGTPVPAVPADEPEAPEPVTGDSVDPRYNQPYVDVNELRSEPVPHRYVHGGFTGTDARFSFYFPAKEQYQGRFFHNTYPMALSEDIGPFPIAFDVAIGNLAFTIDSGAYYVQTNLGGNDRAGGMADPAIAAYRVNAAAAKYSRVVAAELYGEHRSYGYLFGGSGGSYQVVGSAENTQGVWDGFVPFVMATPNAIPSMFTVRMHALRVLRQRDRFPAIMDAINPGGSGDLYAELNEEESAALREATRMGYPPRGWWNHESLDSGYFAQVAPIMPMLDPAYVEDFWSQPGYLGSDPASAIRAARFQFDTSVTRVIEGFPRQVELADVPGHDFADSHLVMTSGAAAGKSIPIATISGNTIGFAYAADQSTANGIRAGDRVRIDNAWGLALQTYQRHQLPTPDLYGWNQYRKPDGAPLYPQRDMLIGPIAAAGTAATLASGRFSGKMILLECLMDIDALAWQADWYRSRVQEAQGAGFEDHFALWFIDHAQHDNPQTPAAHAHTVSFEGALQQALRDLSAWVEKGVKPTSTQYQVVDTQVIVPADAHERQGIQPVVLLQANGGERAEVAAGEPVRFSARVEVPAGAGRVVAAEWDFEGLGSYPQAAQIDAPQSRVQLSATHAYAKPGTYFAVLRVASQRQGDAQTPFGRVQNIGRVRVVVR
ncbi:PKD domain-containing protein [Solimonas sp. K1W22B-7]|uniref:PKD domain-containing protein n=1 Tax=Solimonas sp. K1W22B-7 TaxID=2303331 RepID=UPI000E3310B3|nr:PKD domain-containing protein [Solimonas sp. K1W22B-7]AXQ31007.1 PKD domain-containing protein [Solimonas sp. K1W22B-7]